MKKNRVLAPRTVATLTGFFIFTLLSCFPLFAAEQGLSLGDKSGDFGIVTTTVKNELDKILQSTGLNQAAENAKTALEQMADGKLPVIDTLSDPFNNELNIEDTVDNALKQTRIVADILGQVSGYDAQMALLALANSALLHNTDFAITLPIGRIRVYKKEDDVSLCLTIVGPGGAVVSTGISNARQLCNIQGKRASNENKQLITFADMAIGYSHVFLQQPLSLGLSQPITALAPILDAATFIKINDQWVKVALGGSDPDDLELTTYFNIGIKAGVNYAVMAEAGAFTSLSVTVKPAASAEIIQGVSAAMAEAATNQLNNPETAQRDVLANVAEIAKAAINFLDQYRNENPDKLGSVSLKAGVEGQLGIGILDTGVAGVTAEEAVTTTLPISAIIQLSESTLTNLISASINAASLLATMTDNLSKGQTLDNEFWQLVQTSNTLLFATLRDLLDLAANVETEFSFALSALGSADAGTSITLAEFNVALPVGQVINTLVGDPEQLFNAISSAIYLVVIGSKPDLNIDWNTLLASLDQTIREEVIFTFSVMIPPVGARVGVADMPLGAVLGLMDLNFSSMLPIFTALVESVKSTGSGSASFSRLHSAVKNAVVDLGGQANQNFKTFISGLNITLATEIGASVDVGAEATASFGAGGKLEASVKGSLLLLLLNDKDYHEKDQTVLASLAMPISLDASAGASLGEGVDVSATAGSTLETNLFNLTLSHWDGTLPIPAYLTVAGFKVLDFEGTVNNDGSLLGKGYLMLPMGGLVKAEFEVDANGNVINGQWEGGFELGPLGSVELAQGELSNLGIRGQIQLDFFSADYILTANGFLLGHYEGDLTIGNHTLTSVVFDLQADGKFSGKAQVDLAGFMADISVTVQSDGLKGSGKLLLPNYLNHSNGTTLEANDIVITQAGISGTFRGAINTPVASLKNVSLSLIDAGHGFKGNAEASVMNPLNSAQQLYHTQSEFSIANGEITIDSSTQTEFFGTQTAATHLTISNQGAFIDASLADSLNQLVNDQLLSIFNALADDAKSKVDGLRTEINTWSAELERLDPLIEARRNTVIQDRQQILDQAQKAYDDLVASFEAGNDELTQLGNDLKKVQDDLNSLNGSITYYQGEISRLNNAIAALDKWYWLDHFGQLIWQAQNLTSYTNQKAALEAERADDAAKLAALLLLLPGAQVAVDTALLAYNTAVKLLADTNLQTLIDAAKQTLNDALAVFASNPETDPALAVLIVSRLAADAALKLAQDGLGLIADGLKVLDYLNAYGSNNLFHFISASFEAKQYFGLDLSPPAPGNELPPGNIVTLKVNFMLLGKPRETSIAFDLNNPVDSIINHIRNLSLDAPVIQDVTAPQLKLSANNGWQTVTAFVTADAVDNFAGTGIAAIVYHLEGAQNTDDITVETGTAQISVSENGTTKVFVYAKDAAGNASAVQTWIVRVDQIAPQITVTQTQGGFLIQAEDNLAGSGVASITVSGTGAEEIAEFTMRGKKVLLPVTSVGQLDLQISAQDNAGNNSAENVKLDLKDVTPPDLTVPQNLLVLKDAGNSTQVDIGEASATDNIAVAKITNNAPDAFPPGITLITWTATDTAGNETSVVQIVNVVDDISIVDKDGNGIPDYVDAKNSSTGKGNGDGNNTTGTGSSGNNKKSGGAMHFAILLVMIGFIGIRRRIRS